MESQLPDGKPSTRQPKSIGLPCCALLFVVMVAIPAIGAAQPQQDPKPTGSNPIPVPAAPAILAAFDKYEVVAMPEAHGMKDVDDFILSLIRNPEFPRKVNDIAVECGNALYQPILDRYIAGEDVPFTEVRKAWRSTTQAMCGLSGFFEQFFPLVREINRKLPPGKRLRVLACDPAFDWDQVKTIQDFVKSVMDRDSSIASVMEKEVLSKHRKALMLFGVGHLMHAAVGQGYRAVSKYERDYPNVTFVISELGIFDTNSHSISESALASWPIPALALTKGTWLGAVELSHFIAQPMYVDDECKVRNRPTPPVEDAVDAFLYVGPQNLRLREQIPADIALDVEYMKELQRRESLLRHPLGNEFLTGLDQQIVDSALYPMYRVPRADSDLSRLVQTCLAGKRQSNPPQ